MTTVVRSDTPRGSEASNVPEWLRALRIIDTDSHFTEPRDLWTRHAPKGFEKRLPHMEVVDGTEQWLFDGVSMATAGAGSVMLPDGSRAPGIQILGLTREDVHRASYDWQARVEMMDRLGIWAAILYPNLAGHGNEKFLSVNDIALRTMSSRVYNDAMAEIQGASQNRLLPMAMIPWWDIDACVVELRRIAKMGMRGITMFSDPHESGLPDLSEAAWEPLWKACSDLAIPVSFHIGAASATFKRTKKTWFGDAPWPSLSDERKLLIGGLTMFLGNARVIANLVVSGVLEKFPELKIVSAESGIGWIPFLLEGLDYNYEDIEKPFLKLMPSEYVRRQVYSCFWFEKLAPTTPLILEAIGINRVMFETDIPHSVCLYPDIQGHIAKVFANVAPDTRRRILQDNAAELYRVDLPKSAVTSS